MTSSAQNNAPWGRINATPFRESQNMNFEFKRSLMAASFYLETHLDPDQTLRSIAKVRARIPFKGEFNLAARSMAKIEKDHEVRLVDYQEFDSSQRSLNHWKVEHETLSLFVNGEIGPQEKWDFPNGCSILDPLTILSFLDAKSIAGSEAHFQTLLGKKLRAVTFKRIGDSTQYFSGWARPLSQPMEQPASSDGQSQESFRLQFALTPTSIEEVSFRVPILGDLVLRRVR